MRRRFALVLLVLAVLAIPVLGAAQTAAQPVVQSSVAAADQTAYQPTAQPMIQPTPLPEIHPHAGSVAIGVDVGVYRPDEELQWAVTPQVLFEFYVTARVSVRLMGGWANPKFLNGSGSMSHISGTANLAYNWEYEYWHPFVSAGVGIYSVQKFLDDDTKVGLRYNRFGFNAAAGVEYFATPQVTLKFELNYHRVHPVWQIGDGPGGLAVTAGVKRYF